MVVLFPKRHKNAHCSPIYCRPISTWKITKLEDTEKVGTFRPQFLKIRIMLLMNDWWSRVSQSSIYDTVKLNHHASTLWIPSRWVNKSLDNWILTGRVLSTIFVFSVWAEMFFLCGIGRSPTLSIIWIFRLVLTRLGVLMFRGVNQYAVLSCYKDTILNLI